MLDASEDSDDKLYDMKHLHIHKFTIPSIAADTLSDQIRLIAPEGGKLVDLAVTCDSENFDISLRSEKDITPPTVKELFVETGIDVRYVATEIHKHYANTDTPREAYLYLYVNNVDAVNATGTVELELTILAASARKFK